MPVSIKRLQRTDGILKTFPKLYGWKQAIAKHVLKTKKKCSQLNFNRGVNNNNFTYTRTIKVIAKKEEDLTESSSFKVYNNYTYLPDYPTHLLEYA